MPAPRSRTEVLQWLDRRVGVPVCMALTGLRRVGSLVGRLFRKAPPGGSRPPSPGSILFIKLAEQGSTVLARPALAAAVERVGAPNVHILVFEENRFIVDLLGLIPEANVHTVRTGSLAALASSGLGRILELRRRRIGATIDLEFFSRFTAALSFLIGSRVRVGFHTYFGEGPYRGDLFTHRMLYNPHLHTRQTFRALVQALDADPDILPAFDAVIQAPGETPLFQATGAERRTVRDRLAGLGVAEGARLVLLNANAGDLLPLRRWEPANYVLLARRLLGAHADVAVVFTGAPDEAAAIDPLAASVGSPRCVSLAGRTTLRELLVLCGLAEVLVTNDSGPAHFAALTEAHVVALFGPESPGLFAASGPRTHAISARLACSPCVNAFNNRQTSCRDNLCMQRITVGRVADEVDGILAARRAGA